MNRTTITVVKYAAAGGAVIGILVLSLGVVEGFKTRTARVELPNGVYFHNLFPRSWDDNVVMRSPDGSIILPPDVVLVKFSETHVFVARRDKGEPHADEYHLYEVATDRLVGCGVHRPCRDLLPGTGISPDDAAGPEDPRGWRDWHRLTRPEAGLVRYWWQRGSAGGLGRTVLEALGIH